MGQKNMNQNNKTQNNIQQQNSGNHRAEKNQKVLIIYYSKTGFTKKYAGWIAESLSQKISCDAISYADRNKISFDGYDIILYGGGFHAGMINGLKWFKKKFAQRSQMSKSENMRAAVFVTGAMPADAPDVEKALRQNFTQDEWETIQAGSPDGLLGGGRVYGRVCKVFYLQSGLCYETMGSGDKLMMAVFRTMLKKMDADSEMRQMVAQSFDITRREDITPIVDWCIEELQSSSQST